MDGNQGESKGETREMVFSYVVLTISIKISSVISMDSYIAAITVIAFQTHILELFLYT